MIYIENENEKEYIIHELIKLNKSYDLMMMFLHEVTFTLDDVYKYRFMTNKEFYIDFYKHLFKYIFGDKKQNHIKTMTRLREVFSKMENYTVDELNDYVNLNENILDKTMLNYISDSFLKQVILKIWNNDDIDFIDRYSFIRDIKEDIDGDRFKCLSLSRYYEILNVIEVDVDILSTLILDLGISQMDTLKILKSKYENKTLTFNKLTEVIDEVFLSNETIIVDTLYWLNNITEIQVENDKPYLIANLNGVFKTEDILIHTIIESLIKLTYSRIFNYMICRFFHIISWFKMIYTNMNIKSITLDLIEYEKQIAEEFKNDKLVINYNRNGYLDKDNKNLLNVSRNIHYVMFINNIIDNHVVLDDLYDNAPSTRIFIDLLILKLFKNINNYNFMDYNNLLQTFKSTNNANDLILADLLSSDKFIKCIINIKQLNVRIK